MVVTVVTAVVVMVVPELPLSIDPDDITAGYTGMIVIIVVERVPTKRRVTKIECPGIKPKVVRMPIKNNA